MKMTLEDAKFCLVNEGCKGCKFEHDDSVSGCCNEALEIAVSAINYLMLAQKLGAEMEEKER